MSTRSRSIGADATAAHGGPAVLSCAGLPAVHS